MPVIATRAGRSGQAYGYVPGASGSYFATPDSAANSIANDIDIIVRVVLNDYTPASEVCIISKWTAAGNQRSWTLDLTPTSTLKFYISADGSTSSEGTSTSAGTLVDRQAYWIRVTRAKVTGETLFYQSSDAGLPAGWTQIGNAVTIAANSAIFDGTAGIVPCGIDAGTSLLAAGSVYRAQIYNGIGGTLAVDFNPNLWGSGDTFTAATGEVWTRNGNAKLFR